MANEFYYNVSLSIIHPTIDPKTITASITTLGPRIETTAGTERCGKGGKPLVPSRTELLSHWSADLHENDKIYSGMKPLSDFVLEQLAKLEENRDLFLHLRKAGQVLLVVGWFSESNHSANVLGAEMLRKCGDLGVDIEIDFYAPDARAELDETGMQG
jgi:hypothetical protein